MKGRNKNKLMVVDKRARAWRGSRWLSLSRAFGVLVLLVLVVPLAAHAGGLPWDRGLNVIGSTLTGVVAGGVAVIAIAAAGLGSAVNADLGGATQKIVAVVIIMSMVGAAFILVGNLGLSGALVP